MTARDYYSGSCAIGLQQRCAQALYEPFSVDQQIAGLGVMEGSSNSGFTDCANSFLLALHQYCMMHCDARSHDQQGVFGKKSVK